MAETVERVDGEATGSTGPAADRNEDLRLPPTGTIENSVLIGKDDTLFLAGGSHTILDIITGTKKIPQQSLENFARNIKQRQDWALAHGAGYLHLIFPDKQSIFPELWPGDTPIKVGQLYMDHCAAMNLPLLYPSELLRQGGRACISRVDTHVTSRGSILIAAELVRSLTGLDPTPVEERLYATLTPGEAHAGDLGSKLSRDFAVVEEVSSAAPPGDCFSNGLTGGNNGVVDIRFHVNAPLDKRVVVFGDSFGREIARFLQFWFREILFFRSGFFHTEIAERCRPDFVLTENIERYLDYCYPDSERLDFFLYGALAAESYQPSAEFTKTLAAMLDVRGPAYRRLFTEMHGHPPAEPTADPDFAKPAGWTIELNYGPLLDETRIEIEPIELVDRVMPAFMLNLSRQPINDAFWPKQDLHSSDLVARRNVLVFGPNIQLRLSGQWACESRSYMDQVLDLVSSDTYEACFPGPKPRVDRRDGRYVLHFDHLSLADIHRVREPVFLATPLEPDNWGRWLITVVPKLAQYQHYALDRAFFCHSARPWQKALIRRLSGDNARLLDHDPGLTYFCEDVLTVDYSVTNMTVSRRELERFQQIAAESRKILEQTAATIARHELLFVSRLGMGSQQPSYRVLLNESHLADRLAGLGFAIIQPESLSFDEQAAIFSRARLAVFVGGAALYNAVFLPPEAAIIDLESGSYFLGPHCEFLCSIGRRFGVIVGCQDETDALPIHKRWTIDVESVVAKVTEFL